MADHTVASESAERTNGRPRVDQRPRTQTDATLAQEETPESRALAADMERGVARIRRTFVRGTKKVDRLERRRGDGLPLVVKLALAIAFLVLVSIMDYPLFEVFFGFAPVWIWLITISLNGVFLSICHKIMPKTLHEILNAPVDLRGGGKWWGQVVVFGVCTIGVLGFSVTTAVARARAFADESGVTLGSSAPGFIVSLLLFLGLLLVFFGAALLLGWQEIDRAHREASGEPEPEISTQSRQRIVSTVKATRQACLAICGRENARIKRRAVRMGRRAPAVLPEVAVPDDIDREFERLVELHSQTSEYR